jgi:hypothetical protein
MRTLSRAIDAFSLRLPKFSAKHCASFPVHGNRITARPKSTKKSPAFGRGQNHDA